MTAAQYAPFANSATHIVLRMIFRSSIQYYHDYSGCLVFVVAVLLVITIDNFLNRKPKAVPENKSAPSPRGMALR